jgi:Skp family chaperone for outer membrane proteins
MTRFVPSCCLNWLTCVAVGWLIAAEVHAQPVPGPPRNAEQGIGVVDVAALLREEPRLRSQLAELQLDAQRAERHFGRERDELKATQERLQKMSPGSAERVAGEKELAKRMADLGLRAELQKKEFLQRESRIYYQIWKEIMEEIREAAKARGLTIVLRAAGGQAAAKPEDMLREMNQLVLWTDQALDITSDVRARMARRRSEPRPVTVKPPARNNAPAESEPAAPKKAEAPSSPAPTPPKSEAGPESKKTPAPKEKRRPAKYSRPTPVRSLPR